MFFVVHGILPANHIGIATKALLPEVVAEYQYRTGIGPVILVHKRAAIEWCHSQYAEEVCRNHSRIHTHWLPAAQQAEGHLVELDHRVQSMVLRTVVFDFLHGERHILHADRWSALLQMYQVIAT